MNGDTTLLYDQYEEGNRFWFKEEYCAQQTMIQTLFQLKKYKVIHAELKNISSCAPYYYGARDTLAQLAYHNRKHKQLTCWCKKYAIDPDKGTLTWLVRYEKYKKDKTK